jgi:hypothetical protein
MYALLHTALELDNLDTDDEYENQSNDEMVSFKKICFKDLFSVMVKLKMRMAGR